ncbi:hypothetical protein AGMMS50229_17690 [Campylobacterota bacterium]|nr:hypothetical protein AGMMS50229_17690 [Campylobacterota bacterium]
MKKMMAFFALIACAFAAQPLPQITIEQNRIACFRKSWLEDSVQFGIRRDVMSMNSYISMKRCVVIPRTVAARQLGQYTTSAQFLLGGKKLWISKDALRKEAAEEATGKETL